MPSTSRRERKRDELQRHHDLLSEKIQRLRAAHAIKAGAAERFELEKQIEQAEAERDAIERQIEALERELERKGLEERDLPTHPTWRVPAWLLYASLVTGILVTLSELLGLTLKGLRFLGAFATNPRPVLAAVVAFSALTGVTCGYVLLAKRRGIGPWRQRPPAYGTRHRMIARIVLVTNIAVTLILILGVLRFDVVHAQPVAGDQLGVAVAQFGEGVDVRASARGREMSAFVARNLRREIDLLPGLAGNVTVISGPLVKSTEEAQRVAAETSVALVIWGWMQGETRTFAWSSTRLLRRTMSRQSSARTPTTDRSACITWCWESRFAGWVALGTALKSSSKRYDLPNRVQTCSKPHR
jgi:hypothetical protein